MNKIKDTIETEKKVLDKHLKNENSKKEKQNIKKEMKKVLKDLNEKSGDLKSISPYEDIDSLCY